MMKCGLTHVVGMCSAHVSASDVERISACGQNAVC
jgi:hypothetical protein